MSRLALAARFAALLVCLLVPPAGGQGNDDSAKELARYADEVFRLTNEARKADGLPAFRRDARLDKAAGLFSRYMGEAGFFDHVGPDGKTVEQREVAQGYRLQHWGENIAWGSYTPKQLVDGWMNSPRHRANILNPKFKDIGIGIAVVNGKSYMTQDFGTLQGER